MAQKPMNQELLNIDPLILKSDMTKTMKEVTSLAIFQSSKSEFDPNGLFSVPIISAVVLVCSYIASYTIRKVPFLGKYMV